MDLTDTTNRNGVTTSVCGGIPFFNQQSARRVGGMAKRLPFVLAITATFTATSLLKVAGAENSSVDVASASTSYAPSLVILPAKIALTGRDSQQRLVLQRTNADGMFLGQVDTDVTWESSDPSVATVELVPTRHATGQAWVDNAAPNNAATDEAENGKPSTDASSTAADRRDEVAPDRGAMAFVVRPHANGTATISARKEGRQTTCIVTVHDVDVPNDREFRRHVLPVFAKQGCNSGACHGALAGKGGFKLSLRGYDPPGDYVAMTQEARGRRIELGDPGRSLVLAKPSGALPHKGGLRLDSKSAGYAIVARWIRGGAPPPSEKDADLVSLTVSPDAAILEQGDAQQLIVQATYSDGRTEDVTEWAKYSSTDATVTDVDPSGRVKVIGRGEGAVVVWFSSQIVLSRVTSPYSNDTLNMDRDGENHDVGEPASHSDDSSFAQTTSAQPANANTQPAFAPSNFVDTLVLDKLAQLGLRPSPRCDDATFLRRVYLDTIGMLPTSDEVVAFLNDRDADKRDQVVDSLLSRKEFVDYWSYRWSDVFLVNGKKLRPDAVKAYYEWIRGHVEANTPWDEMVREVVTARGFSLENGETNFYALHQTPEEMAENVSQAFLGLSIGCAKCHNHPLEKWTNDQYYAMANLFSRVRVKGWGGDARSGDGRRTLFVSSRGDLTQPLTGKPQPPAPLDAAPLAFEDPRDRRVYLAEWLTAPENPYFSRAIANRVWANFMGVGLVEQIDDLRVSNPASNEALLSALADLLVERHFDLKALMQVILQSETYQRSSQPIDGNRQDKRFYSRYYPRRLMAEVLLDAISQVTGTPTEFQQIAYDGADVQETKEYPLGTRAIELYDSAVASDFLNKFGRNKRDIVCECERSNKPSMVQVLHISNGTTINDKLKFQGSCVDRALQTEVNPSVLVEQAYLSTLCRYPTSDEREKLAAILASENADAKQAALEDLYWSLMSSREFLFTH